MRKVIIQKKFFVYPDPFFGCFSHLIEVVGLYRVMQVWQKIFFSFKFPELSLNLL